ncbi:MAG TPA: pyruvate:ferredoxin (flavodoxin) oxidoreductase, partial [Bacteroidales bacterium]|nr:pyruvate:ferredoxin (flavodoxin) oxidoreductase [Bacteroidales bacterium]
AMGSVCDTIKETVDHLNAKGERTGMITVHLYRPFSARYFLRVMPKSVKSIAVLDRTKEPGALGEPLYMDVRNIFADDPKAPIIVGGRYGLSSKDTTPAQIMSVFENLGRKEIKNNFTIGIIDDVTFRSLPMKEEISVAKPGTYECKFFGLGSDGTVGANKNTIKIIGETTPKYCQAYFQYDSKKSGGFTCSHLRFGDKPINSPYLVTTPDFVACHVPSYLYKYDILKGIKKGGTFLLNSLWDAEETKKQLPDFVKRTLAEKNINFYIINATKIAEEIGLGGRTNTILQSAFFKIAAVIPYDLAVAEMKDAIVKSYGKKGEEIVAMNYAAVDRGGEIEQVTVDPQWKSCSGKFEADTHNRLAPEWVKHVADVVNAQNGDDLPVSVFKGYEDGTMPAGTAAYEKRGIAIFIPEWNPDHCIQCNQCAYVCPHAAIRPFVMTDEEAAKAPESVKRTAGNGPLKGYQFTIQVSPYDCAGCGNCADICPAKTKALTMKPASTQFTEQPNYDYLHANIGYKDTIVPKEQNVKNLGFTQPLFEFSGACSGCGETPYVKVLTQLFGDHMMVANATGCSSIYSASFPSSPYCKDRNGRGPAWANSLFEDNAEFGLGMRTGSEQIREKLTNLITSALETEGVSDELKSLFAEYLPVRNNFEQAVVLAEKVVPLLKASKLQLLREIFDLRGYLTPRSQWIIGGDGWAYDIGYGGLDHVLASGENVNVLVLDTEVYSNTGGQSSKSTPAGAVAKFASSGKKIRKKDLGMMAMSYGYVYVAQVAMGANNAQLLKAMKEAEAYDGPSLIIAYSPCINHGLSRGMGQSQLEEKLAVECGYWQLYRYNPTLADQGKNPFTLDSKEPDWSKFQDFIKGEVRYSSLLQTFPDQAAVLFVMTEEHSKIRYNNYKRLAQ